MRKVTKTQKIGLVALLVLACTVVGYVFIYKHVMSLYVSLHEMNKELASVTEVVENKQVTISLLEETKYGRKELEKYFVSIEDPTQFLNLIDTVADEVGVESVSEKVEIVEIEKPNSNFSQELQKKVEVLLSVTGEWEDIYHFISLLEIFPYIITIDKATLNVADDEEKGGWKGKIQIHAEAM